MKILANDGIAKSGLTILQKNGYTVLTETIPQEQLATYINTENIEVLIVRSATKVRKDLIDACPNLKMVIRGGVGMDNIDVDYARSKGVKVHNTPASSSQSVAELVMGHLFAAARFLRDSYKNMEHGDFKVLKKKYGKGTELRGKTLLIIGFGRIGQSLASYALGCGIKVVAVDFTVYTVDVKIVLGNGHEVIVPITTVTDLKKELPMADFVSLHIPKQENGQAVIGKDELAMMKPSSYIVNCARGGVVDEEALLEALNNGKIAGAALDVFDNEPTPNSRILSNDKIATSPHIGAATEEAQERIGEEIAQIIMSVY